MRGTRSKPSHGAGLPKSRSLQTVTLKSVLEKDVISAIGGKQITDVTVADVLANRPHQESRVRANGPANPKYPETIVRLRHCAGKNYVQSGGSGMKRGASGAFTTGRSIWINGARCFSGGLIL